MEMSLSEDRAQLVDAFLLPRTANSQWVYANALRDFVRSSGGLLPHEVETAVIERWYRDLLRRLRPSTVKTYVHAVGSFLAWVEDMGVGQMPRGWRSFRRRVRREEHVRRALTDEELRRLMREAAQGPTARRDLWLLFERLEQLGRSDYGSVRGALWRSFRRGSGIWSGRCRRRGCTM